MRDLEARVERLEAIAAIQALKARYTACADAKYTADRTRQPPTALAAAAAGQADCFAEDAVWEAADSFGGALEGRAALAEWFARPPWRFALHLYAGLEIEVDGDVATGRWRLWQVAAAEDASEPVLLVAITHETYRREADGTWRIARMRFEQLHTVPLAEGALAALAVAGSY